MSAHLLEAFVRDVSDLAARATDPKLVVDEVAEGLRRLLAGPFFLDEALLEPGVGTWSRREIARDPHGRFGVVVCAWAPGQSTPIHDHTGWAVVGAVARRVLVTSFRRVDDGSTPGYASLNESTRTLVSESSFSILRPGEESAHRIENPWREPAATIHVLAVDAAPPSLYDPTAKTVLAGEAGSPLTGV